MILQRKRNYRLSLLLAFTIVAGGLTLPLSSCKTERHEEAIAHIDSLHQVVNDLRSELSEIDTNRVSETFATYSASIKEFGKYFTDVRDSNWTTIGFYSDIRKPLRNFLRQYALLYGELDYSAAQLSSLKTSIDKKLIPSDSISIYLLQESDAIFELEQRLRFIVKDTKTELVRFDSLYPIMNEITAIYKKQNPLGIHKNQ